MSAHTHQTASVCTSGLIQEKAYWKGRRKKKK